MASKDSTAKGDNLKIKMKDTGPNGYEENGEEDKDYENTDNWYELRLQGKLPERRAHHSSFVHENKYGL